MQNYSNLVNLDFHFLLQTAMIMMKYVCLCFLTLILLSLVASLAQAMHQRDAPAQDGWWSARRDTAGIAPDARQNARLAVVQVYAAPTWGWNRGGGRTSVDHF